MASFHGLSSKLIQKTSSILSLFMNLVFYGRLLETFKFMCLLEQNTNFKSLYIKDILLPKIILFIEAQLNKIFVVQPVLYDEMDNPFYHIMLKNFDRWTKNIFVEFKPEEFDKFTSTIFDLALITKDLSQENLKLDFYFLQELNFLIFLKYYTKSLLSKISEKSEEKKDLQVLENNPSAYEVLKLYQNYLRNYIFNSSNFAFNDE
jgi:hypothetical protein